MAETSSSNGSSPMGFLCRVRRWLNRLRRVRVDREDTRALGKAGEEEVARLMRRQGCRLLAHNFRCKRGEIDIIALDGDVICFVEVKTRLAGGIYPPERNVNAQKRRRIRSVAKYYLKAKRLRNQVCRFDIAAVVYPEDGPPEIEIMKNAF